MPFAWRFIALVLLVAMSACASAERDDKQAAGRDSRSAGSAPSGRSRPAHPWTQRDTLRVAISVSPNTLDPILSTQQFETQLEALVLDPLVATVRRAGTSRFSQRAFRPSRTTTSPRTAVRSRIACGAV
jgi:ABC-type transport system substrate-binding protein